jgi:hypothetical protein
MTTQNALKYFKTSPKIIRLGVMEAVNLMRTRIELLAQSKYMRSTIDATQRKQRHG